MVKTDVDGMKVLKIGDIELAFPENLSDEEILESPAQDVMSEGFRV